METGWITVPSEPAQHCGVERIGAGWSQGTCLRRFAEGYLVMITDVLNTGIILLMIILVAVPAMMAIARTVQQHLGRRR